MNQCTVSGNNVSAANGFGGGVYNTGAMAVNQSTLSGNSASLGGGGGIYNNDTLTVNQSTCQEIVPAIAAAYLTRARCR